MSTNETLMIYVLNIPTKLALTLIEASSKLQEEKGVAGKVPFQLESISDSEAELKAIAGTVLPGLGLIDGLAEQMNVKPFSYTPLQD